MALYLKSQTRNPQPGGAQRSPSPEADPAMVARLDRGANAESMTTGSEEPSSSSDELRKEFLSVLGTVEACEWVT